MFTKGSIVIGLEPINNDNPSATTCVPSESPRERVYGRQELSSSPVE